MRCFILVGLLLLLPLLLLLIENAASDVNLLCRQQRLHEAPAAIAAMREAGLFHVCQLLTVNCSVVVACCSD